MRDIKYIGLYFQTASSVYEEYFELGRIQLKDQNGNDVDIWSNSEYIGWAAEHHNGIDYEGPGNDCLYRNHDFDPHTRCLLTNNSAIIGFHANNASKKFPFLAPFKLGKAIDISNLTYTQRDARSRSLSSRKVTRFSLMGSYNGLVWFTLHEQTSNSTTQDNEIIFENQPLAKGNAIDLSMFIKFKPAFSQNRIEYNSGMFNGQNLVMPLLPRYSFGVVSDLHVNSTSNGAPEDIERMFKKFENRHISKVFCCGDITTNHTAAQLSAFTDIKDQHQSIDFYSCTGNHDVGLTDAEWQTYVGHPFKHWFMWHNDAFIFMPIDVWEGSHPYQANLEWLEGLLQDLASTRVFLFMHFPLNSNSSSFQYPGLEIGQTYGFNSNSEDNAALIQMLKDHGNVIVFTGHSHYAFETQDEQASGEQMVFFEEDGVSHVHVPSLSRPRDRSMEYIEDGHPELQPSQGLQVDVYDKFIKVRGIEFNLTTGDGRKGNDRLQNLYVGQNALYVKLPYDAEVEYLESTGTQWIDTGVIPTVHTGIETDIAITYAPYDQGAICGMCGSGLFAGGGSYSQYIYRSTTETMTGYTWAFGSVSSFGISIPYGTRTVFGHNFLEDGVVRVDGVQKATLPSNPTLLQYPIALMKLNVANDTSDMRFYVKGRLYHVRISDGSIISHNFVPVRFTNSNGQSEGAMYDRVSGELFRNSGTGEFTIGPDK